ncbi:hypothetical protein TNCV_3153441 [Trichonephila clavipes]|nr:hypothetical protein TNCV_3153441 [Trichonephila clavipes]
MPGKDSWRRPGPTQGYRANEDLFVQKREYLPITPLKLSQSPLRSFPQGSFLVDLYSMKVTFLPNFKSNSSEDLVIRE